MQLWPHFPKIIKIHKITRLLKYLIYSVIIAHYTSANKWKVNWTSRSQVPDV